MCNNTSNWRDDWRLMGQEGYLMNKILEYRNFDRKLCVLDFDQCDFCYECFDEDPEHPLNAYFEPEEKVWICEECFNYFKPFFHWKVIDLLGSNQ